MAQFNLAYLILKPVENFLEMCVYTIWACMGTLGGVTLFLQPTNTLIKSVFTELLVES